MRWKILLIAIFALLIAWFTLSNATEVSVNFFFVTARTSLIFVILISVLLGMCLTAILWATHAWKLKRDNRALQRQIQDSKSRDSAKDTSSADGTVTDENTNMESSPSGHTSSGE